MIQHFDPVPFTIENEAHMGMSETQGIIFSDGTNLIIEYQIVDAIVGLVKTDVKEIAISIADLWTLKFRKKYFGLATRVYLRSRRQRVVEGLPESRQGEVEFRIKRRDREAAENFCLAMEQIIMRHRNELVEGDVERERLGE